MIIGVPKEIKNNENRVSMTPAGAHTLVKKGHRVLVQKDAGKGSGFSNEEFTSVGAEIIDTPGEVFKSSDMIVKVKEPQPDEVELLKEGQLLFTYLHLAAAPELTKSLMDKKITCIAYETVQLEDGSLPLLTPMSEVAGRMSVMVGAEFLSKAKGGSGILLSGVPGVKPAKVVILGAGTVGMNATKMAVGLGADVMVLNKSPGKLKYLEDIYGSRIKTLILNEFSLAEAVKEADLLIGGILIPGAAAPKIVKEYMVESMRDGSVIVDVAIDQGGCVETVTHATTHDDPVYVKHGVIHYSVANMPGAYARTSTFALTNTTLPYIIKLAGMGFRKALDFDNSLRKGVNVIDGKCTYESLARSLDLPYARLEILI
ncbi:alanine dehydrogenase [Gudongella sp. DL1XJH-153]|uniref:alanine dehydrogenase n=1 Tax=Gudongella sp. DL1XJH-153 TaxID=3409804 RepID=UPI003BB762D4